MAAPVPFVSSVAGTASTSPTVTLPIPPSLDQAENDHILSFLGIDANAATISTTTPSGWTKLGEAQNGTGMYGAVYLRAYQTGDTAPTVTITGAIKKAQAISGAFRTADPLTPLDVAISWLTPIAGATQIHAEAIPITMGATRVVFAANDDALTALSTGDFLGHFPISGNSGGTTDQDFVRTFGYEAGMADGAKINGREITGSVTGSWVLGSVILRPAVPSKAGLLQYERGNLSWITTTRATTFGGDLTPGSLLIGRFVLESTVANDIGSDCDYDTTKDFTLLQAQNATRTIQLWYYENNQNGAGANKTVTLRRVSTTAVNLRYEVAEYKTEEPATFDASGSNTGTGTSVSVQATPTANDGERLAIVLGANDLVSAVLNSWATGYNRRQLSTSTPAGSTLDRAVDPGGSAEVFTGTLSASTDWVFELALFKAASLGQLMVLDEDITVDGFETNTGSTTDLWDTLNESARDDSNYIRTTRTGTCTYVGRFAPPPDGTPESGTCTPGPFPVGKDSAGGTVNWTIDVLDGASTVIATDTVNNVPQGFNTLIQPPTFNTSDVTDWGDVRLRVIAEVTG